MMLLRQTLFDLPYAADEKRAHLAFAVVGTAVGGWLGLHLSDRALTPRQEMVAAAAGLAVGAALGKMIYWHRAGGVEQA